MLQHVTELTASEVLGYRDGLRQPAQRLCLQLDLLVSEVDWAQVDRWLDQHLGVPPVACPALPGVTPEHDADTTPAAPWFWRVMCTAAALLRWGGVPVFEPGRLLRIVPDPAIPQRWHGEAAIAQVDYFARQHTVQAFEAAALVVCGLVARPDDFNHPEPLCQQLEAKVIGPMWQGCTSTHSSLALLAAAYQAHIPWRHQGHGIYQLGWGARQQRLQGRQWEGDSLIGQHVAQHKDVTAQWLRAAGLPVPEHVPVEDAETAVRVAQQWGNHVVIKPAVSVGGQGVTRQPRSAQAVRAAFATAAQAGGRVLVEKYVAGDTHHVQVVQGRVQYVLRRHPVGVMGDGQSTVAELVMAENRRRQQPVLWQRPLPLPLDALARHCLAQAGWCTESRPAQGVWVPLRDIPTNADGGRDEDVTTLLHPDNARMALAAVRRLGLAVAGVDILSPDIRQPWHVNGAVINEINHAPNLAHSPSARATLPAMLARWLPEQSRLPVEVFVGDHRALESARERQQTWHAQGVACFLSSHDRTEGPQGALLPLALNGAFFRARALLMDPQVAALVLVLQTDEWLSTGLPVDRLSRLEMGAGSLLNHRSKQSAPPDATQSLEALLRAHLTEPHATPAESDPQPPAPVTPAPADAHQALRPVLQTLTLRLSDLPTVLDWPRMDRWLAAWRGQPLPAWPEAAQWAHAAAPAQLAWRITVAATSLLAASGTPIFEPGTLIDVRADAQPPHQWHCTLGLALPDGTPEQALTLAYATCTEWLQKLAHSRHEEDGLAPFYRQLETQVLPILLAQAMAPPSTLALLRAASAQTIPWQHEGHGIFQLGWGRHARHVVNSRIDSDSALGIGVVGHKLLAAQWLRRAGLPAPVHQVVSQPEHAVEAAHLLGWPVVVKPVDRDRGEGVTINLRDDASLRAAFAGAARFATQVLVEQQVAGVCHRLLVGRGKVLYVVKRLPVAVQGDGIQTARQLIAAENARWQAQPPWRRPPPLRDDALAQACLHANGLALEAVVPPGYWAPLRLIESTADGGRDEDMMAVLHPDNAALALRAAALFGLDLAGVDLISSDIRVPWHANGAIINEVNASPTLGASPMSLAAMPALLAQLIEGNGRIPLDTVVAGPSALVQARTRQHERMAQGLACYVTTDTQTFDPQGQEVALAGHGLTQRCRALLRDKAVGALVLIASPEALDHLLQRADQISA